MGQRNKFIRPNFDRTSYSCPHCNVLSQMIDMRINSRTGAIHPSLREQVCHSCGQSIIWHYHRMVHPNLLDAPLPHKDFPKEFLPDFEEARGLYERSPQACCAFMRRCIHNLCIALGGQDEFEDALKILPNKGLPQSVLKAFDLLRLTGRQKVYPGKLDSGDNKEQATGLFKLANIITSEVITRPKNVENIYKIVDV